MAPVRCVRSSPPAHARTSAATGAMVPCARRIPARCQAPAAFPRPRPGNVSWLSAVLAETPRGIRAMGPSVLPTPARRPPPTTSVFRPSRSRLASPQHSATTAWRSLAPMKQLQPAGFSVGSGSTSPPPLMVACTSSIPRAVRSSTPRSAHTPPAAAPSSAATTTAASARQIVP